MKHFIITGASKGLGEGIAIELISEDHHLICIARGESTNLKKLAAARNCRVSFISFDLSVSHDIPDLCERVFELINTGAAEGIYLVNNAGVVQPVKRSEDYTADEVDLHIRTNLLAPMLLTSGFIKHTKDLPIEKRILNISSGAAQFPYYGWGCYCSAKAGMEMFGRCVSEEQRNEPYPVETMAVAPGIIDTNMQTIIRSTNDRDFVHKEKFVAFKESGELIPPSLAGKKLAHLLLSSEFKDGQSIDIRTTY